MAKDCKDCRADKKATDRWREEGGLMPKPTCKGHEKFCKKCQKVVLILNQDGRCDPCELRYEKRKTREWLIAQFAKENPEKAVELGPIEPTEVETLEEIVDANWTKLGRNR